MDECPGSHQKLGASQVPRTRGKEATKQASKIECYTSKCLHVTLVWGSLQLSATWQKPHLCEVCGWLEDLKVMPIQWQLVMQQAGIPTLSIPWLTAPLGHHHSKATLLPSLPRQQKQQVLIGGRNTYHQMHHLQESSGVQQCGAVYLFPSDPALSVSWARIVAITGWQLLWIRKHLTVVLSGLFSFPEDDVFD